MMQDRRGVGAGGAVGHGQWVIMAIMIEFAIVNPGIAYESRKRGHSLHDAPSRLFERVRVASHCPVAWTMTDAGWDDKWAEEMLVPCWASSECSKLWTSKRVVSLLPLHCIVMRYLSDNGAFQPLACLAHAGCMYLVHT